MQVHFTVYSSYKTLSELFHQLNGFLVLFAVKMHLLMNKFKQYIVKFIQNN